MQLHSSLSCHRTACNRFAAPKSGPVLRSVGQRRVSRGHHVPLPLAQPCWSRSRQQLVRVASKDTVRPSLMVQTGSDVIRRFYDAQNRRDVMSVTQLLASDVSYENLAVADTMLGRTAVGQFYGDALSNVPPEARFQIDHITGDAAQVAVAWRLVLTDSGTLMSRGLSYYCLNADGHIEAILDNPEHAVKLSRASLSFMAPLVKNLSAPVLPALKEASSQLQDGLEQLGLSQFLEPLNQLLGTHFHSSSTLTPPHIAGELPERAASSLRAASPYQRFNTYTPSRSGSPFVQPPAAPPAAAAAAAGSQPTRSASPSPAAAAASPVAPAARPGVAAKPSSSSSSSVGNARVVTSAPPSSSAGAAAARPVSPMQARPPSSPVASAAPHTAPRSSPVTHAVATAVAAPAAPPAVAPPVKPATSPVNLTGLWVLDKEASDGVAYEQALDLLALSGLQKMTARLIEALEVKQDTVNFDVEFITVVPFFKVAERIPFTRSVQLMRRDLRSGKQTATAERTPTGVRVTMKWPSPFPGGLVEDYEVREDGALLLTAVTTIHDASVTTRQVYRRSAMSRDAFMKDSQKRNGNLGDAMRRAAEEDRRRK